MRLQSDNAVDGVTSTGSQGQLTLGQLVAGAFLLETMVAKATSLSHFDHSLAIEKKLVKLVAGLWESRLKKAIATAVTHLGSGGHSQIKLGAVSDVLVTFKEALSGWAIVAMPLYRAAIAESYRLGKQYGHNRAYGVISQQVVQKAKWGELPLPGTPPLDNNYVWAPNGIGTNWSWKNQSQLPAPNSIGGKLWQKVQDAGATIYAADWKAAGGSKEDMAAMASGSFGNVYHPDPTHVEGLEAEAPPVSPPSVPPPPAPHGKKVGGPAKGGKMAEVKPHFGLVDKQAIDAATEKVFMWLGDFTHKDLPEAISKVVKDIVITNGQDASLAATQLGTALADKFGFELSGTSLSLDGVPKVPTGFKGDVQDYLEVVSSNAVTLATNMGTAQSFKELHITEYTIVNPEDERTCDVCNFMSGQTFETQALTDHIDNLLAATNADEVKAASPWVHTVDEMGAHTELSSLTSSTPLTGFEKDKLAGEGFAMPPYHGRCRCSIDIAESSELSLEPVEVEPMPSPEPPAAVSPLPTVVPAMPQGGTWQPSLLTPDHQQQELSETAPWAVDQMKYLPDMQFEGVHTKLGYQDPQGDKWIYKPQPDFRAMVDRLAAELAIAVGRETTEVYMWSNGKAHGSASAKGGSIQKMFKGVSGDLRAIKPEMLTAKDASDLQKEHLFDWLISQHDSHCKNVLQTPDGLKFIDKGQAFRFLGKDSLNLKWGAYDNPNPQETYYHTLFNAYAQGGNVKLSSYADMNGMIKSIEGLDNAKFSAMLRPYAKAALAAAAKDPSMKSMTWMGKFKTEQAFIDFMVERKENIRKDVHAFYTELEKKRAAATGTKFKPIPLNAEPTLAVKPLPEPSSTGHNWQQIHEIAQKSGWTGGTFFTTGEDYDSNMWTLYGTQGDGSFLHTKLKSNADLRLGAVIQKLSAPSSPNMLTQSDPHYNEALIIAKSFNNHMKPGGDQISSPSMDKIQTLWTNLENMKHTGSPDDMLHAQHYLNYLGQIWDPDIKAWNKAGLGAKLTPFIAKAKPAPTMPGITPSDPLAGWSVESVKSFDPINRKLPKSGKIVAVPGSNGVEYTGSNKLQSYTDRSVYRFTTPSGDHIFYRPHTNLLAAKGDFSYHTSIPIEQLTPQELDKRMSHLADIGLAYKAADAKDMELLYLRKVAFKAKLEEHTHMIASGGDKDEQIKKLKEALTTNAPANMPIKFDKGYNFMPVYDGGKARWNAHYIPDDVTDQYTLFHNPYGGLVPDLKKILNSKTDALISTMAKTRVGIPVSRDTGMSPDEDITTGGAQYTFTRIAGQSGYHNYNTVGFHFKGHMLKDLDAITYKGDKYGKVSNDMLEKRHTPNDWGMLTTTKNETIFKDSLSLQNLDHISAGSVYERNDIIGVFKKNGYTEFAGKKIEDLVTTLYH